MISPADARAWRLVVQRQLVAFDCRPKFLLQRAPFAQSLVHVGFEEAEHAAPFGLGTVERGIGVGEQRRGVGAVDRIDRDADAQADAKLVAVDHELLAGGRHQPVRKRLRRRRLCAVGRDHRELVATEPGHERATDRLLQALRHRDEEAIADAVAEGVVDRLEAVEVERERSARDSPLLGRSLEPWSARHSRKAVRFGQDWSANRGAPYARSALRRAGDACGPR